MATPNCSIRATFTPTTITVYQAYNTPIASAAVAAQTFVAPFKRSRMTWIKPSFTWMAYRSGYAAKDSNQERILAVEMTRDGFEWALTHAALSHWDRSMDADEQSWKKRKEESCVRVQWDPERDVQMKPLPWRSLQVGLTGDAVRRYCDEWIVSITDVTADMVEIGRLVGQGKVDEAKAMLPPERVYELPEEVATGIGMTMPQPENQSTG